MKKILITLSILATTLSVAQNVNVNAKGEDVRSVIHEIFTQAKQNYVFTPSNRFVLYISLQDRPFLDALKVVCQNANLAFTVRDGVYYIDKAKPKAAVKTTLVPPVYAERLPEVETKMAQPIRLVTNTPKPKSEDQIINSVLKTNLKKTDIRVLCQELGKQAGVQIILDSSIPSYKMDAVLDRVTLKFALTELCKAAGLNWSFITSGQILITKTGSAGKSG
ncbi:MAG: hypothetical protein ABL949_14185 [Fimbriimonadaceae bacterium]